MDTTTQTGIEQTAQARKEKMGNYPTSCVIPNICEKPYPIYPQNVVNGQRECHNVKPIRLLQPLPVSPTTSPLHNPTLHPKHSPRKTLLPRIPHNTIRIKRLPCLPKRIQLKQLLKLRLINILLILLLLRPPRIALATLRPQVFKSLFSLFLLVEQEVGFQVLKIFAEIGMSDEEIAEVAATTLAETIGVVCRGRVGDPEGGADVGVAEVVGLGAMLESYTVGEWVQRIR
jgi:hypothetical protein